MDTRGKQKDLEKDSNPVVQSTNISGVTTDSSAKTIGQSEPVQSWVVGLCPILFIPFIYFFFYSFLYWRVFVYVLGLVITVVLVE